MASKLFAFGRGRSTARSDGNAAKMTCELCGGEVEELRATDDAPYKYTLSGLVGVYLSGIAVRRCVKCRVESPIVPKIAELHLVISETLVRKPVPLTGSELRFLRKNAGFSAQEFAALLEIDPAHLSRFENGKYEALGRSTDRLARAVVMAAADGDAARNVLLHHAAKEMEQRKSVRGPQRPMFRLVKNRWRFAA